MRKQSRKFTDDTEGKFCNVAAAVVGGAIIGGVASNMAAGTAAGAQEDAANQSNATQLQMYEQTRADNAPFLANGTAASNKLAYLLGTGGTAPDSSQSLRNDLLSKFPTWTAGGNDAVAGLLDEAPKILSDPALQQAWGYTPDSLASLNQFLGRAQAISQAPDTGTGDAAYGSLLKKFDTNDLNADVPYQLGYGYAQSQAATGINRLAAANGSLNSGAQLKALQDRGVQVANQYAGDAYNRFTTDQTNTYNKLAGASGAGQMAASTVDSAGTNAASGIANTTTSLGNARGASAIAQANSINSGVGSISNYYQQQNMLNSLNQNNSGYAQGSANYNGYIGNSAANGFGSTFTQNGYSTNPAYGG